MFNDPEIQKADMERMEREARRNSIVSVLFILMVCLTIFACTWLIVTH